MNTKHIKSTVLAVAISAALTVPNAHAVGETWDLVDWTPLWGLSAPGSAYAAWNVFGNDPGTPIGIKDSTPENGSFGLGAAYVWETGTAGAFLTGGGNIYSFSFPTNFVTLIEGQDKTSPGVRDVALRIETLGMPLDASSVLLGGVAPTSQQHVVGAGQGMGGDEEEWLFEWKGVANGAYTFAFEASSSSMSLSQAAMYISPIAAVPEPHEWALMLAGLGMVGFAARARRGAGKAIG